MNIELSALAGHPNGKRTVFLPAYDLENMTHIKNYVIPYFRKKGYSRFQIRTLEENQKIIEEVE